MARSPRKRRTPNRGATRRPAAQRSQPTSVVPVEDEPLIQTLRDALRGTSGFEFIGLIGLIVESIESMEPMFEGRPPDLAEFVDTFLAVNIAETTAALHVLAAFTTDELLAARIHRELGTRRQPTPWPLSSLPQARVTQAWLLTDDHGDVDDILLGIDGLAQPASFVFQVHRYLGRVTDAFVSDLDVEELRAEFVIGGADRAVELELTPADARARLESTMGNLGGSMDLLAQPHTEPSDTWPAYRPLAWMLCRSMPAGGNGYPIDVITDRELASVCEQIVAHPHYVQAGFSAESGSMDMALLRRVVEFAGTAGFNEPWRWSPRRAAELLEAAMQWDVATVAARDLPKLLRVVTRVAADHVGAAEHTYAETRSAIDALAPGFREDLAARVARPPVSSG